jgi:nitrite reductase/ring-hydroxylating ferredoxin subunit
MKRYILFVLILPFVFSCDTGTVNNRNPNIPNYTVYLEINLSLPQYSNLQFASNHIVNYSQGARGIVVFNAGSNFVAFELACPNQPYSTCTTPMTINGVNAECDCDNTVYSLFSGQSAGQPYPMKQYRVDISGGTLIVTN